MENPSSLPFLLVTANVGSVFEDPSRLLHIWIKEFLSHVATRRPAFIALHLQEVGGKTYEKSMEYVQEFIKNLCESAELADYNRIRVYLDEDYNSAEHFTALGNLYFAIRTIENLQMWNFLTHEWDSVEGKNIHTGNIESVATKEKAKFPQQFFPECKWSRKGFLRTRWSLNGTIFDLVNIHLFHDASNLAACEEYPSVYCKSRRRALVHTLERFHKDTVNKAVPYFVFGDFNFRCDTEGVIKKLTEDLTMHRIPNPKNDSTKVQYRDSDGSNVLTVGKKEFTHCDQGMFKESWLRQFDRELESLRSILYEYPITFPPSYPYEEDPQQPGSYMSTRCPAWCDRILVSPAARKLIDEERENGKAQNVTATRSTYGIIGETVCMGDHKPIYLNIRIKTSQGILNYCSCDTHAHKRVEHISNSSTINVNNNSCNSILVSKLISSSSSNANNANRSNNNNNNNNIIDFPTFSNELMTSNPPSPTSSSTSIRASATTLLTTTTTTTTTTTSTSNNSSPLPNKHHCSHCCGRIQSAFDQILSELDMPFITSGEAINHNPGESIHPTKPPPPVSISVFDTESNANVCMCSLYSSSFSIGGEPKRSRSGSINCLDTPSVDVSPQICPNCRNIIKHQPMEHRKTLISRRLMLANDIVVNRIDTTYLHTYTSPTGASSSGTAAVRQFEPYTPESVESHSPVPESVDKLDFDESRTVSPLDQKSPRLEPLDDLKQPPSEEKPPVAATVPNSSKKNNANSTAGNNSNSSCGGVSPRQLKSRLEKLKRISDRRKQYQQSRSANNSGGTLVPGGGTASGDELLALEESGKSSRKELVALGSLEGGGDARVERSDHKLIDWCQRHCCAIL